MGHSIIGIASPLCKWWIETILVLIVFSINWFDFGFKKIYQYQNPSRIDWDCLKGDVSYRDQPNSQLFTTLSVRPLATNIKIRAEILGLKIMYHFNNLDGWVAPNGLKLCNDFKVLDILEILSNLKVCDHLF